MQKRVQACGYLEIEYVIRFQLNLAVYNSLLCCLILQTAISYHIILMYCHHYKHTGL